MGMYQHNLHYLNVHVKGDVAYNFDSEVNFCGDNFCGGILLWIMKTPAKIAKLKIEPTKI